MNNVPNNGYNSTGFIPSSESGNTLNSFLSPTTKYPAKNPASNAPKNPEPPLFASSPPRKPTTNAGLSAILYAIYPASTGKINPKAKFPIT